MSIILGMLMSCSIPAITPPETLHALVQSESSYNPFAITVTNGKPVIRQPQTREEAERIIEQLEAENHSYSVGLGQINSINFEKYQLTGKDFLDHCISLDISQEILKACYDNSPNQSAKEALTCYFMGNDTYGVVKKDIKGKSSAYIERIINNYTSQEQFVVPSVKTKLSSALNPIKVSIKEEQQNVPFQVKTKSTSLLVKNPPESPSSQENNKGNAEKPFRF